ncbi:MAG: sulfur carrier protein ThiS [Candidatus Hydrogenedentes bacterium]|nr:sulfur carrier protein ThiS [Candidatus Hydrogenedentota bacterium]
MEITLNGERRSIPAGGSLLDLIDGLALPRDAVVIERNGKIVDRADYGETLLAGSDVIELVRIVGGG